MGKHRHGRSKGMPQEGVVVVSHQTEPAVGAQCPWLRSAGMPAPCVVADDVGESKRCLARAGSNTGPIAHRRDRNAAEHTI